MTPTRKKRLISITLVLAGLSIATALALTALQDNLMHFYSPSDIAAGKAPTNKSFRIGGLVVSGTVKRNDTDLMVMFDLTDGPKTVAVQYTGILPDLFREGQGIVANGRLNADGHFVAQDVLAKHDEKYMPPEVARALAAAKQNNAG